eukprot:9296837-Heterocapsa_arctica.AAC.1
MERVYEPPNSESEMTKELWDAPYCQPGNSNGADNRRRGKRGKGNRSNKPYQPCLGGYPREDGK